MQVNYCFGCMEHIESYPCPHCGYVPSGNATAYTLRPGSILRGKYLVGKVLGQGGFGITYIGMDLALQRKVAIKEFYPANCVGRETGTNRVVWYDSPQAQSAMHAGQEQFLKEARKMSRVSNIGTVVHVFDVFQENETAYICMEFIEGQTLQQMLKQTGSLPWVKAREIFLPVIQTMAQVHRQGLVHRDLSPDNLMIQRDGTVKILDLGAAKDLNLNTGISSMQVAKGGFSPLEQYLSSGESGSWTDVYALAATMYYALTGVVPPTAMDRLNRDTLRWDLPQLQTLPTEVYKALNHALAVRKEDRIQTMEEFSAELEQKSSPAPMVSRHPPVKLIIAALLAVAALGIGIANFGKEPRKDTLSVPETTETVSKATETVLETTEPIPETVPETTIYVPTISLAEAEEIIVDIAGKPTDDLVSIYTNAVKFEKFWKYEGTPVYPHVGSGVNSFVQAVIDGKKIATPLLDKSKKTCGWKYTPYPDGTTVEYRDAFDKTLFIKTDTSAQKYFYDSAGTKTRTVLKGSTYIEKELLRTYIEDCWYAENGESLYCKFIIDIYHDNFYSITVYDSNDHFVLEKEYDFNGKFIESRYW